MKFKVGKTVNVIEHVYMREGRGNGSVKMKDGING
jgi:hypothetical protein